MTDIGASRKSHARTQFNAIADDVDPGPFAHFGKRLVAAAEIKQGHRVLDIASGRGAVLFASAEQVGADGEAIGIDLAEEMVRATNEAAARRGFRERVQVMDGERLDFADATFDRVLCGFGIMFFPDQVRALREFRRVIKPGGRIALSTWRVAQTSELRAAMAELGVPQGKLPGWITEPDELSKRMAAAGFAGISVVADAHAFRYADVDDYWRQARNTGMRGTLDALQAADAARVRDALTRRVSPDGPGEFYLTSTALMATASR